MSAGTAPLLDHWIEVDSYDRAAFRDLCADAPSLRDLVERQLGAPSEVLDKYRTQIQDLERELYGTAAAPQPEAGT